MGFSVSAIAMMLKVILLVCVLVPTVHSQSKYCCFPDQWEATEGVLSGSADAEGDTAITQVTLLPNYLNALLN